MIEGTCKKHLWILQKRCKRIVNWNLQALQLFQQVATYDSRQNSVRILDRLPDDLLERGNFDIQADAPIQTNWTLLPNRRE